jgi:hypothetical protein
VLVDFVDLKPGASITDFIRSSVSAADAVICIVSAQSLSSAWVVFEAVSALHNEHANRKDQLIACAADQTWLLPECRLDLTTRIDDRIGELDGLLTEYLSKRLNFNDLSAERSRLIDMRDGLGDLLSRLRESYTIPLTADDVVESATQIADYLRELRGQAPSRTDPRNIRARAGELRSQLWNGRTDEALDRLLDLVTDFSDTPKHIRDATLIANTLRRIERAESEGRLPFAEAEAQRQPTIYKFLELIDEIELRPQLPLAS